MAVEGDGYLLHGGFEFVFGQVARPDDYYLPTCIHQGIVVPLVTFAVTGYLVLPECRIGLGQYELSASFMPVPETAVDKDRRSVLAHDDVRFAGHALDIEPVAVSVRPKPFPDRYLRLCRLAAYM